PWCRCPRSYIQASHIRTEDAARPAQGGAGGGRSSILPGDKVSSQIVTVDHPLPGPPPQVRRAAPPGGPPCANTSPPPPHSPSPRTGPASSPPTTAPRTPPTRSRSSARSTAAGPTSPP